MRSATVRYVWRLQVCLLLGSWIHPYCSLPRHIQNSPATGEIAHATSIGRKHESDVLTWCGCGLDLPELGTFDEATVVATTDENVSLLDTNLRVSNEHLLTPPIAYGASSPRLVAYSCINGSYSRRVLVPRAR
eukprot:scaffold30396_cov30-Prasinocladus_malaysianus.AAC.1